MTIIVYRAEVMAADSQCTSGGWKYPWPLAKIRRVKALMTSGESDVLVGFAGDPYQNDAFCRYLATGKDRPDLGEDSLAIVVEVSTRRIWRYARKGQIEITDSPFVVAGSGCPVALGALHAGATAEETVRIVSLVDTDVGGPIQVERLED